MDKELKGNENNILFYNDEEGNTKIEVILEDENVWLNQISLSKLFETTRNNITMHIKNIYDDEELEESSTSKESLLVQKEGNRNVKRTVIYYNLDMIISIGFRVNSKKAIKFRTWANKIIKEYMIKGFALDDDRFLKGGKVNAQYFDELLERIKTIRTSERMAYQKITDLFIATAVDYSPKSEEAYTFFKIVQNKLHYAISGHTATELIYERANAEKEHMGLTNWRNSPDGLIYKYDVTIAKNYLNEEELKKLNDLTNFFIVFAEDEAKERHIMTMQNWIDATDDLLKFRRKKILENAGSISHKEAIEKAENEYEKFKVKQDIQYISSMDEMYQRYLTESNTVEKTDINKSEK